MNFVVKIALVFVGIIHLLPLSGVLGPERLAMLYGVTLDDPNLAILMRHRAVLFGMLGAFLIAAAWRPALQMSAFALGLVSVVSFLVLAYATGGYNAGVARVVTADLVALALLVAGAVAYWRRSV